MTASVRMDRLSALLRARNDAAAVLERAQNELDGFLAACELAIQEATGHFVQRSQVPPGVRDQLMTMRGVKQEFPEAARKPGY